MMQNHARRFDILGKYTYICTVKAMNSNEYKNKSGIGIYVFFLVAVIVW